MSAKDGGAVGSSLKIVALGGGHGLYATLSAARRLASDVTAVVTVADDGGSSGRLRAELGVLPPGDLRMALAALAAEDPRTQRWAEVLQHRFGGSGALAGHSVGNLILAGLTEVLGDPVSALEEIGSLLGIEGQVVPMALVPLDIEADVSGLEDDPRVSRVIRGQVAVATTPGKVRRVRLTPPGPPATPEAIAAIEAADLVVLGPGSWFSSVIPHVLVPDLLTALETTAAQKVLILNLAPELGETTGFSAERHLHVLSQHAPDFSVDYVVVDSAFVPDGAERDHVARAAARLGADVMYVDVAESGTHAHHFGKLAAALGSIVSSRDEAPMGSARREGNTSWP
ncbi:uridine diphosphate-N-acetylglucosamine-binding protein YvcK [Rhodococcus sp. PAMC28707]|uniref:gluconeogenesis factor YvcK family protein n=1 Tax=unclassified Rhodococcus (in: high G+C Gram-positive bacteria) TaxID=192944 RepID=UPI00109E1266|nr:MULTISPECIES: uridine diphosphate-N-acetylglucosamine-binding protein YvcK [unclassified Rhodococcus (in: high G+C Gram-positive bacteria)]QCB51075.1 uridine diphosphate-N-acetylglucosamine-binding protein YvcK [Rhodococcus sp. PAMC28705]QCB57234.1 uridine diphosphate-N-acetylglucosamine-binding protein YvcK [Rhodococcus sp. PAMC28707]